MNRYPILIIAVLFAALITGACSKGYESQKTVNDLRITLSVDRYPLVKGDNVLKIKTADASGKAFTDAVISARYYMPPMAGMAPMDFNTQAILQGDHYAFSADIPMEGGWKVEVSIARAGNASSPVTFNLDAR